MTSLGVVNRFLDCQVYIMSIERSLIQCEHRTPPLCVHLPQHETKLGIPSIC